VCSSIMGEKVKVQDVMKLPPHDGGIGDLEHESIRGLTFERAL